MSKIQASMILEILGRPAEHVKEALETLVTRLGAEKGVKIIDKHLHEPIEIEKSKDLFSTFAEVRLELDAPVDYFRIMFAYMPSNIEVISPEKLTLQNIDLNEVGSGLVTRLHNYDAVAKRLVVEKEFLLNKIKELSPDTYKQLTTAPKEKENREN